MSTERVEADIARRAIEQQDREDKRNRAHLKQRKHEQHGVTIGIACAFACEHHRPAQAHHLPGDEHRDAVLQADTPNAPNKLSDAPIHHVPVRPESGEPSQQAKVAGTRPKPNSHSAEGSSLNAIRCDASANGKSTRGVAVGKASRQATTLSTQPAVSEYLTNARTRRSGERMAAVSHSALAARIRSALKLPSSHPLLGATEEQQQRVNDGCGVRRTPG